MLNLVNFHVKSFSSLNEIDDKYSGTDGDGKICSPLTESAAHHNNVLVTM